MEKVRYIAKGLAQRQPAGLQQHWKLTQRLPSSILFPGCHSFFVIPRDAPSPLPFPKHTVQPTFLGTLWIYNCLTWQHCRSAGHLLKPTFYGFYATSAAKQRSGYVWRRVTFSGKPRMLQTLQQPSLCLPCSESVWSRYTSLTSGCAQIWARCTTTTLKGAEHMVSKDPLIPPQNHQCANSSLVFRSAQ